MAKATTQSLVNVRHTVCAVVSLSSSYITHSHILSLSLMPRFYINFPKTIFLSVCLRNTNQSIDRLLSFHQSHTHAHTHSQDRRQPQKSLAPFVPVLANIHLPLPFSFASRFLWFQWTRTRFDFKPPNRDVHVGVSMTWSPCWSADLLPCSCD